MGQSKDKPPTERAIRALLDKHACPVPYHEVRTRLLGNIACPDPAVQPMAVIAGLWGGALPEFDSMDDANALLGALVMGLWNELADHQDPKKPFRATRVPLEPTGANLGNLGMVRAQEVEGFVEGLFNGEEEAGLPERAHEAVTHLGEIRAMMAGVADLIERTRNEPEDRGQIKETIKHLRVMTEIMETEIHAAVLACTRARAQTLPGITTPLGTRH
ncbi:hypothetical protein WSK_4348 [Novosphingobium sp. Rr 2-17]|uniref:UPF0149 family protein n=1 Tax=Novosphingobium sp. Rr 2-17 TaxID=555793 RepID=UPI0002697F37|nr:UPF0149 family protein [Novosphingobium sp. Rr 2-17]EIZ77090.1 hypothetical protein WSK_4348 [Novosphingobium sp. Rr 2-17]